MAQPNKNLTISVRSFLTAILVLLVLMVGTYGLTFLIPAGEYARIPDISGNPVLDPGSFTSVSGGIPFWKFLLSPVLVLGADGGGMVAAILVFLLVIGGVFTALDARGLMAYMLNKLVLRFGSARYGLLAAVSFSIYASILSVTVWSASRPPAVKILIPL